MKHWQNQTCGHFKFCKKSLNLLKCLQGTVTAIIFVHLKSGDFIFETVMKYSQ